MGNKQLDHKNIHFVKYVKGDASDCDLSDRGFKSFYLTQMLTEMSSEISLKIC